MSEWDQTTVGDIIDKWGGSIKTGPFGTALKASEYSTQGVPLISVGEIGYGTFNLHNKTPRVGQNVLERLPEYILAEGDVVFGRKGAVDRSAVVGPAEAGWFLGSDGIRLRLPRECDPRFLGLWLRSAQIRNWILQHAGGTTMASLNQGTIRRIPVRLPDPHAQRQIRDTLGLLDDKIDLNRRMNETLEAMARAIFKDWFVDFGPTRAKMEGRAPYLAPSLLALFPDRLDEEGKPEGWLVGRLGEYARNFDAKRVPLSGAERSKKVGPYPYHGATSVMAYVDEFLFDGTYLLIGEDGSVAKENGLAFTQYVWGKFWVNNHAHVLQGRGCVSTEQLLLYFQHEPVAAYVTGAVQAKLSQGRMNTMPFLFGGEKICEAFADVVSGLFDKRKSNSEEILSLEAIRDLLLPKLMAGEIRINEAAKVAEAVL